MSFSDFPSYSDDSGYVQLVNGDAIDVLNALEEEVIDLIITSPPYNIGKSYEKRIPLNEYMDQQEETYGLL